MLRIKIGLRIIIFLHLLALAWSRSRFSHIDEYDQFARQLGRTTN